MAHEAGISARTIVHATVTMVVTAALRKRIGRESPPEAARAEAFGRSTTPIAVGTRSTALPTREAAEYTPASDPGR